MWFNKTKVALLDSRCGLQFKSKESFRGVIVIRNCENLKQALDAFVIPTEPVSYLGPKSEDQGSNSGQSLF